MIAGTHPVLSCEQARRFEAALFEGDEMREWAAMQAAGGAIAEAVALDFEEIGGFPEKGRVLVLAGKGHNGGDALIAARGLLERFAGATAEVIFPFGERALRPLAMKAWRALTQFAGARVRTTRMDGLGDETEPATASNGAQGLARGTIDLCLDGVFGFQFRPPIDADVATVLERVNALPVRLRAAVDLPSGGVLRADFTYATGSVKTPALDLAQAGRLRYLDLGFFASGGEAPGAPRVLTPRVLAPLTALRSPRSDKRTYGHLFVIGGSRSYPGAVLLAVLAALRSGVGLVTAFAPESLVPAFAAQVPEAMWVGWPETRDGGLALEGEHLLRERIEKADALAIGPGLAREAETMALVQSVVATVAVPVLLDADALQRKIVRSAATRLVLTPHAGEFARIAGGSELESFASESGAVVVLKGPVTRVAGRAEGGSEDRPAGGVVVHHSFFGGPVLGRGGSGDVLAGLIGGLLAQTPQQIETAAVRGVVWHGMAADLLARARGQVSARTTELIDFLPAALRTAMAPGRTA